MNTFTPIYIHVHQQWAITHVNITNYLEISTRCLASGFEHFGGILVHFRDLVPGVQVPAENSSTECIEPNHL